MGKPAISTERPLFRVIARHNPGFEGTFVAKRWWSSKAWTDDVPLDAAEHYQLHSDYRLTVEPMPAAGNQARIEQSAIDTAKKLTELQATHEQLVTEHQKLTVAYEAIGVRLVAVEKDVLAGTATTVGQAKEEADLLRASLDTERTEHGKTRAQLEESEEELRVTKQRLNKYEDESGELRDQVSLTPVDGPPADPADSPKGGKKGR